MWLHDEYLALDRIADREREARAAARVRGMTFDGALPLRDRATGPSGRRVVAGVIAAGARGAFWLARQVDGSVELELRRTTS